MVEFSDLPAKVHLLVLKKVREEDLYETGRVCQEWFFLTLSSFTKRLTEGDVLLKNLTEFYNENSGKRKRWQWSDLAEHVGSNEIVIERQMSKKELAPILKHGKRFTSLSVFGLTNDQLSEMLAKFSRLTTLAMLGVSHPLKNFKIPKTVENIKMAGRAFSSIELDQLFEDPSAVKSMNPSLFSLLGDLNKFANLTKVTAYLTEEHVPGFLQMVKSCTQLSSLKLSEASITENWHKLFPKNVKEVHLDRLKLSKGVKAVLGVEVLYERELLFYLFQDWKSLDIFTSKFLDLEDGDMNWGDTTDVYYQSNYTCKVNEREEYVSIDIFERSGGLKKLTFSKTELVLRGLKIDKRRYNKLLFEAVPSTVKNLEFCLEKDAYNEFSPYDVCEDPTNLERLVVRQCDEMSFKGMKTDCFRGMVNLVKLELLRLTDKCISSILTNCTALKELEITKPSREAFRYIPANIISGSLKRLTINDGGDTLADVLQHFPNLRSLILAAHPSRGITLPDPQILAPLRLLFVSCKFLPIVANEMNKSQLACAMFFREKEDDMAYYMVGSPKEVSDMGSDKIIFAYVRGLPTRPLEARGTRILTTVHTFNCTFEKENCNYRQK